MSRLFEEFQEPVSGCLFHAVSVLDHHDASLHRDESCRVYHFLFHFLNAPAVLVMACDVQVVPASCRWKHCCSQRFGCREREL